MQFLVMFPINPYMYIISSPFNSKTPVGLTPFWPLVALSSLTPARIPSAPIGGEGLCRRRGLSGEGGGLREARTGKEGGRRGGSNREEHFFRKSIKEAGIDSGF